MAAVAMLGVTNLLTPLSYASAQTDLGNFDSITFPVAAKSFRFVMPAHDVFLYAVTEANKYYVHYNGSWHTSWEMPDDTFTYDETWHLSAIWFYKTWYTFTEWKDWSGVSHEDQAEVLKWTTESGGTVDIYAQWNANRYNIHYDLNDSTGTSTWSHPKEPTSWLYDDELTIPHATREWYTFSGWYITGMDENPHIIGWAPYNGETKDHEDATSYSQLRADNGDVYVAARWDPNTNTPYKVRHYLQDIDGNYWTGEAEAEDKDNETWTTDTEVKPAAKTYLWYDNENTPYSGNINADGNTVFFYHYPRERHTLTLNAGRWIATVTATGTKNTAGITTSTTATTGFLYEEPIVLTYELKNWYTWATWSWYLDDDDYFTMTGQDIEKTAYADTIEYTVTYDHKWANIHVPTENPTTYTVEAGFKITDNPTRSHSTFVWWSWSNWTTAETPVEVATGTYWNLSYEARYSCHDWYKENSGNTACIPRDDIEYYVRHLQANLAGTGYDEVDTDTMTGTTEQETEATANDYKWFTADPYVNVTITWTNTITIDITYHRNTNSITMVNITGTDEGFSAQYSTAPNYKYGDTITLTHSEDAGYTWNGWTVTYTTGGNTYDVDLDGNTFSMPDGAVTITPSVTVDPYTITMYPHGWTITWGNTTGYNVETPTFSLPEPTRDNSVFVWWKWTGETTTPTSATNPLTIEQGTTWNKRYEAEWRCKTGYTMSGDECIANVYTVSVNYKDDGNAEGDHIVEIPFKYDSGTWIPNPEQSWYTFAWWTVEWYSGATATVDGDPLVSPTSGEVFENLATVSWATVTLVANWTANTDTQYVVHYYIRDLGLDTYTLTGTYTWTTVTNSGITLANLAESNPYSWFTYSSWYVNAGDEHRPTSGAVTETHVDKYGNTVINLYYDRDMYHVYLRWDAHVATLSGENNYYYGDNVTVDMTAEPWYHFKQWQKKANKWELWITEG